MVLAFLWHGEAVSLVDAVPKATWLSPLFVFRETCITSAEKCLFS